METDRLIGHLETEVRLCKELVAVLQRETESIVARDYKALYEIAGQKEHLVMRVNAMAEARLKLVQEAASALGVQAEGAGLSSIMESAGVRRRQIEDCAGTIVTLAASIKEINSLNSAVMASSLENVRKTLGFLGNFLQPSVYKPGGAIEEFAVKGSRLSKGA